MFKKVLCLFMLLSISIGLFGCAEDKAVSDKTVSQQENIPINIVDINGDEEYKKFYEEHAKKIKSACEKLGLDAQVDGSSIRVNEVDDSWMDINMYTEGNKANLSIYAMKGNEKSIDKVFSEVVSIVNSYFNYNFKEEKIKESLDENGTYFFSKGDSEEDYASFSLNDSVAEFDICLANLSNVSEEPLTNYITKEEAEKYNIYDNGKLDKLLSDFNLSTSDISVDTIESNYIDDLSVYFIEPDIELVHNYSLYNGELYSGNQFRIYVDSKESIKERFNSEDVKNMFAAIYDDKEIYDKILEKISSTNMDIPEESTLDFDVDSLGTIKVSIYDDMYDDGTGYYYISVDYKSEVK